MPTHKHFNEPNQFMIAEFNALQERAKMLEEIRAGRINFYLLFVAAVGASFSAFSQFKYYQRYASEIILIICLILLALGFSTLFHSTEYSRASTNFYRAAGRIRRWFYDQYPQIAPYLPFAPADDIPNIKLSFFYVIWRGAEPIVILINTALLAIINVDAIVTYFTVNKIVIIVVAFLTFTFGWLAQNFYVYQRMDKSQKRNKNHYAQVRFPFDQKEYEAMLKKHLNLGEEN